jgi:exopolysaccharide production protein ExoQ
MNPPSQIERAVIIVLLLLSTGAFLNLFLERSFNATAGLPFMQLIWVALYVCVLYLLIRRGKNVWLVLLKGWPFLLLLAVALLSIAWSDAPWLTTRRSLGLLATTMAGLYIAVRFGFAEQLKLLMQALKIAIVLSFIFGVLHLGRAVDNLNALSHTSTPPWYGIFTQRNALGMTMALSTLVFLQWSCIQSEEKWSAYFWALLSFILILLSRSMTGLLSICLLLLFLLFLRHLRLHPRTVWRGVLAGILAVSLGLAYAASHLGTVVALVDRDVTLSGRTTIWGAAVLMGMDRPWIGHGFDAFWLGDVGPSGEVRRIAGWDVPGAHNGFLEIWLDLGLLGLALFWLGFVRHAWKSMRCFLREYSWEEAWPVLCLVLLFLINLTQNALLSPNYIFWILYVTISYRVCLITGKRQEEGAA